MTKAADRSADRPLPRPLAETIGRRSQTAIFGKLVRDFMGRAPLAVATGAPAGRVVADMAAAASTSALVLDGAGRIIGIVTERDIARKMAFQAAPAAPIDSFATRPVLTVGADDHLYRAVARMRRHNLRHMPVVDAMGRPVGLVNLIDALSVAADQMVRQIDLLSREGTLEGMAEAKRAQVELASDLLADNLPAPDIQALITEINHDLHCRILDGIVARMAEEGWGAPPVPFTLLIMGSGGRGENFLFPDQDNGFILSDYSDADHTRIDSYFIPLAERLNLQLDKIGFPLCKGHVMARNPLWRKTASQWRAQTALWARRRSPAAILFADIFFDFRAIWGPLEPATELRQFVTTTLAAYPALLSQMCRDETVQSVAIGLFGRLVTASRGEYPGRVDLKLRGTMPLVSSVRLLAVREGVSETATLARIAALAERGPIERDEADALVGAFNHVTSVLLRQQLSDFQAGLKVGNFVAPQTLSRRERKLLVDSLRAIEEFRTETRSEFTGALF
ncbi:MAG: CBS domain-containing protein [Proteobacteria bacterium]|nr:CBS domain-containing protein [Pseudomonadota bacterium]